MSNDYKVERYEWENNVVIFPDAWHGNKTVASTRPTSNDDILFVLNSLSSWEANFITLLSEKIRTNIRSILSDKEISAEDINETYHCIEQNMDSAQFWWIENADSFYTANVLHSDETNSTTITLRDVRNAVFWKILSRYDSGLEIHRNYWYIVDSERYCVFKKHGDTKILENALTWDFCVETWDKKILDLKWVTSVHNITSMWDEVFIEVISWTWQWVYSTKKQQVIWGWFHMASLDGAKFADEDFYFKIKNVEWYQNYMSSLSWEPEYEWFSENSIRLKVETSLWVVHTGGTRLTINHISPSSWWQLEVSITSNIQVPISSHRKLITKITWWKIPLPTEYSQTIMVNMQKKN